MQPYPLIYALAGLGSTTNAGHPVLLDIVSKGDGAVTRVGEITPFLIRTGAPQLCLGVFQRYERPVPNPGDSGDTVPLPLAITGSFSPLPGYRVLLLLDPTIFDVAGQMILLVERAMVR
ncbi:MULTISPECIES: hypothetical protein [unclassified Streptomyces]|uniref:hypothetical protein n=1 Tax=unclassified Streptomyces TaxID=2593676 RepID=UPI00164F2DAB|nr:MULTISPECIES: hypothetical protein [unclassified Streptomyces]WSQ76530.1 hypothetical protein OG725_05225 [Streptomyces sp. NBC_01213]WSR10194.1 hypothetical protein OG265_31130 [Streptomyces sp. NBC_01208]